jgi:hypothetical protein
MGRVLGDGVLLRAVATSKNNFPLSKVNRGDEVRILGREGEWYHVLSPPAATAWILRADIERAGTVEELRSRLDEAASARDLLWRSSNRAAEPSSAPAPSGSEPAEGAAPASIDDLERRVREAVGGPGGVDLTALRAEVVNATTSSDADVKARAAALLGSIEKLAADRNEIDKRARLRTEVEKEKEQLLATIEEQRKRIDELKAEEPAEEEPLFDAIGWIEKTSNNPFGINSPYPYRLVRGGQTLFYLMSPAGHGRKGKYELRDFVGKHIGIKGRIQNPGGITYRVMVIDRLEVLAAN